MVVSSWRSLRTQCGKVPSIMDQPTSRISCRPWTISISNLMICLERIKVNLLLAHKLKKMILRSPSRSKSSTTMLQHQIRLGHTCKMSTLRLFLAPCLPQICPSKDVDRKVKPTCLSRIDMAKSWEVALVNSKCSIITRACETITVSSERLEEIVSFKLRN